MIDRRQVLIGTAVALVAARITPWPASGPAPGLYASHRALTRCFDVGDRVGYVVDDVLRRRMMLFTAAITKVRPARGGGWMCDMRSVGRPDIVDLHDTPPDEYIESIRHVWHMLKLSSRRRPR
jgi:hypothetical protein